MASEAKKNKAKNSYIFDGGEKNSMEEWKCRGLCYYTKRDRMRLNTALRNLDHESELPDDIPAE